MAFVRTLDGKTLAIDLCPTSTSLHALKLAIAARSGAPDLAFRPSSTLTLHLPLLGGTQTPAGPARPRYEFLYSKPPPNYVAGLGPGATGFTTRSDIGPARAASALPDRSAAAIGAAAASGAGRGRGKGAGGDDEDEEEEADGKGYDENQKFDQFEGNDFGLFASAEYDKDDEEADAVWEAIDKRLDSRRKDRREASH